MNPGVALISLTKIDLSTLLPLARELLGYSPAKAADGTTVPLQELAHHLSCITSFKDRYAPPSVKVAAQHFNMLHAGFLVAADERDMVEILEIAGVSFTLTETLARGIDAAIIYGSLAQWRDAVLIACNPKAKVARGTRYVFNSIYKILCKQGMKDMFGDFHVAKQNDDTFLLEG